MEMAPDPVPAGPLDLGGATLVSVPGGRAVGETPQLGMALNSVPPGPLDRMGATSIGWTMLARSLSLMALVSWMLMQGMPKHM